MDWQAEEEKGRVCLRASRPDDGRGLYRAWVCGPTARCLLGTMTPSGGRLVLRRVLPVDDLRARGCWPVTAVEEELFFPFHAPAQPPPPAGWRHSPALDFPDPPVALAYRAAPSGLCRDEPDGGLTLAYPFLPGRPFPLVPLFCLARLRRIEGREYLLFSFDREKNPVLPRPPDGT